MNVPDPRTLRARASYLEYVAAWLRMQAACAEAATAMSGFGKVMREARERDEQELLSFHPDVIDMDMEHAAWNPEAS